MNWLRELDLIYSYTINSISDTEQDYELLVSNSTKMVLKSDSPMLALAFLKSCQLISLSVITPPKVQSLFLRHPEAHLHPKAQSELADVFD